MWPNCDDVKYCGPLLIMYSAASLVTTWIFENLILKFEIVGACTTTYRCHINNGFLNCYCKLNRICKMHVCMLEMYD